MAESFAGDRGRELKSGERMLRAVEGVQLLLQRFRTNTARQEVKRVYLEAEHQTKLKGPVMGELIWVIEASLTMVCGGGRIWWIGLALTHQVLQRASE